MREVAVSRDPVARLAERQQWLTPEAEKAVQAAIRKVLGGEGATGERVRDLIHGSWLREPIHSVMTDVPVGSWTAASIFDALGALTDNRTLDKAADALVVLGLVGATGAAAFGLSDWSEVKAAAPRRVGSVHALLNVAATGVYAASWWARRKRTTRNLGRVLGAVGLAIVSVSAHLGGNMIYEHGIGVQSAGKRWQDASST